jgi:hypothetical protein
MLGPVPRSRRLSAAGSVLAAFALVGLLTAGSCIDTDIGAPCQLVKSGADPQAAGGACQPLLAAVAGDADAITSLQREHPECFHPHLEDLRRSFDKDFVSFGATECENLTCVRPRCSIRDGSGNAVQEECESKQLPADDKAPNGICSGECITDQDCTSEEGKYVCRALVLDDAFLQQLRNALTPEEYDQYFGRIQNAKFCAPKE